MRLSQPISTTRGNTRQYLKSRFCRSSHIKRNIDFNTADGIRSIVTNSEVRETNDRTKNYFCRDKIPEKLRKSFYNQDKGNSNPWVTKKLSQWKEKHKQKYSICIHPQSQKPQRFAFNQTIPFNSISIINSKKSN